jgi:serine protease
MPVRALDESGRGTAFGIARSVRFASRHGAGVINLSLNFPTCPAARCVDSCKDITGVCRAIKHAVANGAVVVVAAGNTGGSVAFPARIAKPGVIAVGATTRTGSLATYSARGAGLDLVAPGGMATKPGCVSKPAATSIAQVSFRGPSRKRFCVQARSGTSMAAAHVSGIAALVIASSVVGALPTPATVETQLACSAFPLPAGGVADRTSFGAGLVAAAAAVASRCAT